MLENQDCVRDLISVIIPVYKVEPYLRKCVDSVINQTYKNLEIILVDDGSPDNCGAICDEYAEKDSRIKVIHKQNGGLSDARNHGVKAATGEYITFLDSDDWLDEKYCQFLYDTYINQKADLVAISLCSVDEHDNLIGRKHTEKTEILSDAKAMESMFKRNGLPWCAQAKLYKRELLNDIEFPVGMLMEDKATAYKIFAKCRKIVYVDMPYYKYLVRQGSIMRSKFTEKRLESFEAQLQLNDFIEKNYTNALTHTHAHTAKCAISALCMMSASNFKNQEKNEEFFALIKKYKKEFYTADFIDFRFKAVCFVISILRLLYREKIYDNVIYKKVCNKVGSKLLTK